MVGSGQTSTDSFGSAVSGTAALGASRFRQRQDMTWGFLRTGISSNIQGKIKGVPRSPLRGSCCQIAWVGDFDSYVPVRLGANRLKNKLSARLKVLDTLGEAKALSGRGWGREKQAQSFTKNDPATQRQVGNNRAANPITISKAVESAVVCGTSSLLVHACSWAENLKPFYSSSGVW